MSRFLRSRYAPWLAGLAMAAALCAGYPAMYAFRSAWQAHYPALASQWGNDGPAAVIGWFGTELNYEELGYADRVNDAANHRLLAFDPYIKENRSRRQFIINKGINSAMGLLQMATRDINATWILTRFLCCLAWFVLIYWLALRATGESGPALFAAAFVTGFSYLLTLIFLYNLSWQGSLPSTLVHDAWSILSYGRTEGVLRLPRAGLTYSVLFLACLCLVKTVEERSWSWAAASAAVGGTLGYIHLDVWGAYLAAGGFLALIELFRDRESFPKVLASWLASIVLSLPFFLANYPENHELTLRAMFGADEPPSFSLYSLVFLPAAFLLLRRRDKPIHRFLAAMALGCAAMMNAGFAAHHTFEAPRWRYIGNIFLFVAALSFLPSAWTRKTWLWASGSCALAAVALLQGLSYAAIHFPFQGLPKDYAAALTWLETHTPLDSSVLSVNPEVNALIPAYTHDKVELAFVPPVFSDYPLLDNYERFLGALRLLGADERKFLADTILKPDPYSRRDINDTGFRRGQIEKAQLRTYLFYITPDWLVRRVMAEGEGHPAALSPDYIWLGSLEREYARRGFPGKGWREVYRNPSVTILGR